MKKGNYIVSCICIILAIFIISVASTYPESKNGVPGPGVFPILKAVILFLSALSLSISTSINKADDISIKLNNKDTYRSYITMGILIFYMILLPMVEMILMNTILLSGLFIWFNRKSYIQYVLLASMISIGVYLLFSKILFVPLDFGLLVF